MRWVGGLFLPLAIVLRSLNGRFSTQPSPFPLLTSPLPRLSNLSPPIYPVDRLIRVRFG